MIAVIQRVAEASVKVNQKTLGAIGKGLVIFIGIEMEDTESESCYLAKKISELRIFPDHEKSMNRSVMDVAGKVLIVSQFTLCGNTRKGRRPSFTSSADPKEGKRLYIHFVNEMKKRGIECATGQFGAMMAVSLVNDGPVTFVVESRKWTGNRVRIP